jgi:hypothetical protein
MAAGRWLLAGALVLDLPGWARFAVDHGASPAIRWLTEADRVLTLATWAALSWRLVVTRANRRGEGLAGSG